MIHSGELPQYSEIFKLPQLSSDSDILVTKWLGKIHQLVCTQKITAEQFQTLKNELLSELSKVIPDEKKLILVIEQMLDDRWLRLQSSYQVVDHWKQRAASRSGFKDLKKQLQIDSSLRLPRRNIGFHHWFISIELSFKQMMRYWESYHKKQNIQLTWNGQAGFVADDLFVIDENNNFCPVIVVARNENEDEDDGEISASYTFNHEQEHAYLGWLLWGKSLADSKPLKLMSVEEANLEYLEKKWHQRGKNTRPDLIRFVKAAAKDSRKKVTKNFFEEIVAGIAEDDYFDPAEIYWLYKNFELELGSIDKVYGNYFSRLSGLISFIHQESGSYDQLLKELWWIVLQEMKIYNNLLSFLNDFIKSLILEELDASDQISIANYQFLLTFWQSFMPEVSALDATDLTIDTWEDYSKVVDPSSAIMVGKADWVVNHNKEIHLLILDCIQQYDLNKLSLILDSHAYIEIKKGLAKDLSKSLFPLFLQMKNDLSGIFEQWKDEIITTQMSEDFAQNQALAPHLIEKLIGYELHVILSTSLKPHLDDYVFLPDFFNQHDFGDRYERISLIAQQISKMVVESIIARDTVNRAKKKGQV